MHPTPTKDDRLPPSFCSSQVVNSRWLVQKSAVDCVGPSTTDRKRARWHRPRRTRCALLPEHKHSVNEDEIDNNNSSIELRATNDSLVTNMTELDKALAVAEEAAAAAGVDANLVKDEVRAAVELGSKEEEISWEDRLTAILEDIGEYPEYWISAGAGIFGIALASLVASAALTAIATVPALAQTFEVIGLTYVFWFGNSYVLSPTRRAALAADVRAMLREARATPNSLLGGTRSRQKAELEGTAEVDSDGGDAKQEISQ